MRRPWCQWRAHGEPGLVPPPDGNEAPVPLHAGVESEKS